jgi:hypothetical protein
VKPHALVVVFGRTPAPQSNEAPKAGAFVVCDPSKKGVPHVKPNRDCGIRDQNVSPFGVTPEKAAENTCRGMDWPLRSAEDEQECGSRIPKDVVPPISLEI